MAHLPQLILDLSVILIAAAVVTLIFKRLRQPVVLGYLVAGLLVGPYVPIFPSVVDTNSIRVWAEIGVIFLLFGLGLEFSFKKLAVVGKTASITALFEVCFMLAAGYVTGRVLGWSSMDSIFLGGILSISSTTIIVRAFGELSMKGRHFVSLVFGVLIVEDLIAILLLVLLSTIAATQSLAGGALIYSGLKLGFFLMLWFIVGIYVVPLVLRKIHRLLNDETTLVVSVSLCLLMVLLATKVGFSPALGAFVMGSILAETKDGKRIERLFTPVRDLFAAIFFVSVGMLLDPSILVNYTGVIALITFVTVVGKFISSTLGSMISGQTVRHSIQAGMSLAQIGEFSFIIATLGVTLKVTSEFLYPIAVAVSAITTFTTPYFIRRADFVAKFIEHKLPKIFLRGLHRYQLALSGQGSSESAVILLWKAYGIKIFLNAVMILAITLGMKELFLPLLATELPENSWNQFIAGFLAISIGTPFLWGILLGPASKAIRDPHELERLKELQSGMIMLRSLIALGLFIFLIGQFTTATAASGIVLAIVAAGFLYFTRHAETIYRNLEERFLSNLDEREREELSKIKSNPELAPWDAILAELVLSSDSELVGKTLMSSTLKERFGVTVALIQRGKNRIIAPGREEILMPQDRLFIIGTEEQLLKTRPVVEEEAEHRDPTGDGFGLESVKLKQDSSFLGKPIRESGIREAIEGLIVGVEREGKRILNPDSGLVLNSTDIIWVVGNRKKIKKLQ